MQGGPEATAVNLGAKYLIIQQDCRSNWDCYEYKIARS